MVTQIQEALENRGVLWQTLVAQAEQVILFGSWAVEKQEIYSDIDLLCVGIGKRFKNKSIDLVWKTSEDVFGNKWLGSELANHVAHFGVWLYGNNTWGNKVFVSERAIEFKKLLIRSRVNELFKLRTKLNIDYRIKHVVKLRRDVQRLVLMIDGQPVEPSPLLDQRWEELGATALSLRKLMQQGRCCDLLSNEQLGALRRLLKYSDWRDKRVVTKNGNKGG